MGLFRFIGRIFRNLFTQEKAKYPSKTGEKYGLLRFVFKKNYGLSYKTENKAIRKHNKLVSQFIKQNRRNPTRFELGRIIINASHITIKYRRGNSGHWGRQKVRHYLFNLHSISYKRR